MIDTAAIIDRITKKTDPATSEETAEPAADSEVGPGEDHYAQLFDALKSGDRASGIAALKECLSGMASGA